MQVHATDGQIYDFSEKAKVKKLTEVSPNGNIMVKFVFRNGEVRTWEMPVGHPLYAKAAAHGLDQKFGDDFAGLDDVEDCIEAFDQMAGRLSAGEWTERRQAEGLAGASLLARALAEVSGKPLASIKERLRDTAPEVKKALAQQPRIAEVINRIKSERAAKRPKSEEAAAAEALFAEFAA